MTALQWGNFAQQRVAKALDCMPVYLLQLYTKVAGLLVDVSNAQKDPEGPLFPPHLHIVEQIETHRRIAGTVVLAE